MKIYDCFQFYNELDILKFRLKLLDPYVDYFVLVESRKTQLGHDKELYFANNRYLFKQYEKKIIYILLDELLEYKGEGDFTNVEYMRDQITRGLAGRCMPDDLVLISDVDEIPNPHVLRDITKVEVDISPKLDSVVARITLKARLISNMNRSEVKTIFCKKRVPLNYILNFTPVEMEERLFYYYMNCESRGKWHSAVMSTYAQIIMPSTMRHLSMSRRLPVIHDAGWHFSYLGGVNIVKQKLNELIDNTAEVNKVLREYVNDEEYINDCLNRGIDLFGRKGKVYEFDFIDKHKIGIENIDEIIVEYPHFFRVSVN